MSKISCELCGASVHAIKIHLSKEHGPESAQPCTVEEYQEKYPDAPLMSELLARKYQEQQQEKAKETKPVAASVASAPLAAKESLSSLFKLGRAKAAKRADGGEIMISVCQQEGFEHMIPKFDDGYVFNIEILKNLIMGLEINIPTFIYGPAGTGKSSIVKNIAAATRRRLIRQQHYINLEESHLLGKWVVEREIDASGNAVAVTRFQPGTLAMAMRYGWLYLADEYDRADPGVLSVYQSVLEGEPLNISEADEEWSHIEPHPDFRIIATGNTNGSGDESGLFQATIQQDAANIERFGIVQYLDYPSAKEEIASIRMQTGVTEDVAKNIRRFADQVREAYPASLSLPMGIRVAINVARLGMAKMNFVKGVELAYANRLPQTQREIALSYAQRIFGS